MGVSRRKIPRSRTYTISEKSIRFWHPDYNPDQAQKLISSSMSRHLSTCNISSKFMHAFSSNLANRQTDRHGQKHVPPVLLEVINISLVASVKCEAECLTKMIPDRWWNDVGLKTLIRENENSCSNWFVLWTFHAFELCCETLVLAVL